MKALAGIPSHLLALLVGILVGLFGIRGNHPADRASPGGLAPKTAASRHAAADGTAVPARPAGAPDGPGAAPPAAARGFGNPAPAREELEAFLVSRGRDPEALLAAGILAREAEWIREAVRKDPSNPHVAFVAASFAGASPEERLAWTRTLAELQPDNAVASYLLAARLLEAGDRPAAIEVLTATQDQPRMEDFSSHTMLILEEAFLGTGSSPLAARTNGVFGLPMNYASDVMTLARDLQTRRDSLSPEQGESIGILTASMGTRLARGAPAGTFLTRLVGHQLQQMALADMPDDALSPFEGLTVAEARTTLAERSEDVRSLMSAIPDGNDWRSLDPQVHEGYIERLRLLGEIEATRWLRRRTDP